jgi:hypothetical protein
MGSNCLLVGIEMDAFLSRWSPVDVAERFELRHGSRYARAILEVFNL